VVAAPAVGVTVTARGKEKIRSLLGDTQLTTERYKLLAKYLRITCESAAAVGSSGGFPLRVPLSSGRPLRFSNLHIEVVMRIGISTLKCLWVQMLLSGWLASGN
jgi:hypothetical protein